MPRLHGPRRAHAVATVSVPAALGRAWPRGPFRAPAQRLCGRGQDRRWALRTARAARGDAGRARGWARTGARTGVSPAAAGLIHGGLESTYLRHGRCWVTSHPSPSPRDWLAVTLPTTATPASPSSLPGCPAARPAVGVQTAGLVSQRSFLLSSPVPRSPVPFLPGEPFSTAFCPPPLSQATHEASAGVPAPPSSPRILQRTATGAPWAQATELGPGRATERSRTQCPQGGESPVDAEAREGGLKQAPPTPPGRREEPGRGRAGRGRGRGRVPDTLLLDPKPALHSCSSSSQASTQAKHKTSFRKGRAGPAPSPAGPAPAPPAPPPSGGGAGRPAQGPAAMGSLPAHTHLGPGR